MSGRGSSYTLGQKPRRQYVSKVTEFFFRELDKGLASPYILLSTGALLSVAGWKAMQYYVEPTRRQNALWQRPQSRVPLSDAHNAFWGFEISGGGAKGGPTGRDFVGAMTDGAEEALRRPTLVHSEASELRGPGGEALSVVCMELPEYDARVGDDVVYRSVHYIQGVAQKTGQQTDSNGTESSSSSAAPPEALQGEGKREKEGEEEREEASSYFSRMPARGTSVIHGLVKCRNVTSLNNCVPYAGHLESEYARKMMLALAPVHILRDIAQTSFPIRLTAVKETPVSALVCGLHSGEISRWMSNAFPNFDVDVVEEDGALSRICRRFLGFQESSNLHLYTADPVDFLCRATVHNMGRRYDLIMLDAADGTGKLSTRYGRLEFINSVRNSLSNAGCVIASIPNHDGSFLYNIVQNWRLAFSGRTVILVHCVTSPHTLLMTFQDDAGRGKANFGTVASVDEFKDLLRAKLSHYGPQRVPFDLSGEVSEETFCVLRPGVVYPLEACLPAGHPQRSDAAADSRNFAGRGGWSAWLRRWSGAWLTPSQRVDLRAMGR